MMRDYALTEGLFGGVVVHRADCPTARALAAAGYPVATLFGAKRPPPADMPRHECLEGEHAVARP